MYECIIVLLLIALSQILIEAQTLSSLMLCRLRKLQGWMEKASPPAHHTFTGTWGPEIPRGTVLARYAHLGGKVDCVPLPGARASRRGQRPHYLSRIGYSPETWTFGSLRGLTILYSPFFTADLFHLLLTMSIKITELLR